MQLINLLSYLGRGASHQWVSSLQGCQLWPYSDSNSQTEVDMCWVANHALQLHSCTSLKVYLLWCSVDPWGEAGDCGGGGALLQLQILGCRTESVVCWLQPKTPFLHLTKSLPHLVGLPAASEGWGSLPPSLPHLRRCWQADPRHCGSLKHPWNLWGI